jgi:hypothetical protein
MECETPIGRTTGAKTLPPHIEQSEKNVLAISNILLLRRDLVYERPDISAFLKEILGA